jgi:hypothetical protein
MMRLEVGTHTCACRSALIRAVRSEVVCPASGDQIHGVISPPSALRSSTSVVQTPFQQAIHCDDEVRAKLG